MATPVARDRLHDSILPYVRREVVRLAPDQTVGDALETIRRTPAAAPLTIFYVVDGQDRLIGLVTPGGVLTADPALRVEQIMNRDVTAIPEWATVLVAAEFFVNRRSVAFPVVGQRGELLGQVDVSVFTDEVVSLAKQSFDDIFQIIGVHATGGRTAWAGFRDRFPWLMCNIAGGILAAVLASRFEAVLEAFVVLALFIPVVLTLAESVSIQSVTLTLQSLQHGRLDWRRFGRGLWRECAAAALLGAGCGTIVGLIAWTWRGSVPVAVAIGGAIWCSMVLAALLGLALPTLLHALRRDAGIAAGPIVLATADVTTLLCYFTLASWITSMAS